MSTLWQDIRYGLRMLARNRGFTVVVTLLLGLGIGAATSAFSVANGVLLRALPYPDPGRLAMLLSHHPQYDWGGIVSGMNFLDWEERNTCFEEMAVLCSNETTYRHRTGTDHVKGLCVSTNLFAMLGWEAMIGRTFTPKETWPDHHYVVLGYDFWQHYLGGDEAVLGKAITLGKDPQAYTVVGIMPPGIRFFTAKADSAIDFWVPVDRDLPEPASGGRGCLRWNVIGRLKSGVSFKQAQAEMDGIATWIAQTGYDDPARAPGIDVVRLHRYVVGDTTALILLAAGAAAVVLLIACANAATLLLARGLARRREMATRAAFGAGRLRLLRQAMTESVLLSLLGGALGILLAWTGVDIFRAVIPNDLTRLGETRMDLGTLLFALGLVVVSGLAVGIIPALRSCRIDISRALKADARGTTLELGHRRLMNLFVASEVGLSLMLLITAGLLINSLSRLLLLDPGYRTKNVLTVDMENLHDQTADEILEQAQSLPGVRSAALVNGLPLCETAGGSNIVPEGLEGEKLERNSVTGRIVSPGYFRLMGIPLLAGRDFTERDKEDAPRVTVINEALARRFWSGQDPIGKRFEFGWAGSTMEIVGVVADTKNASLDADTTLDAFLPLSQFPVSKLWRSKCSLVVVTASDPAALAGALRRAIWSIDRDIVIRRVRTFGDIVATTLAARRFLALVLSAFSTVAIVLASFGLYAVIAHAVRQRTAEIGIRMALGATDGDIMQSVVRQGLKLTLVGLIVGLIAAAVLSRVVASFLYHISPTDPLTFTLVSLTLIGVALFACYIPARRAARIDPMEALRYE